MKKWSVGVVVFSCLVAVVVIGFVVYWYLNESKRTVQQPQADQSLTGMNRKNTEQKNSSETDITTEKKPDFDSKKLQATLDEWAKKTSGTASVVLMDISDHTLASINKDDRYFTASIYKLFVAYLGYQKIADGTYKASEEYLSDYTRIECLDAMLRSSYSPCAEKMWNELGKETITKKMQSYGLKNTSLSGLSSTAYDAALLLSRLYSNNDLTAAHRTMYLDSMKTQDALYRRGLPSGFSKSVTVYNKVGWNEQVEWHDTSIVQFSDGRVLIVAVLTKNVGSSKIAELGTAIESTVAN